MAASATDLFRKITNNFSTTLTSSIGSGDVTLSLASVTNLPTDTAIDLVIDRVDSTGTKTPTKREYVLGVVSGSNLISVVRGKGNSTAQAHASGAVVEYVFDQDVHNDLVTGVLNSMNQDGSLIGSAVRTALNQTAATGAGWTTLGYTPNTVVYNGNRSYTCTINAIDATGTLSPGMRIQTTRTVTAPTKSTSLNGTTQYYSKTSPAGMTFTNNFVVSAWVKLSSYVNGAIAGRLDAAGSNGWGLYINGSGQVSLFGKNGGASNNKNIISYQSIPLNKWVHVAAQLDMTSATNSPTVNYIMIDGVDVPASQASSGTAPTSLVQGTDLGIGRPGSYPSDYFPGKIAQVAIYSAKVTQATILASISQTLTGSETSLISAYSFNNTINDLNTTNANNLTANNGAVATNADTPFTQTNGLTGYTVGTTNFGIVTASSFSTNTTLTVQVPEGDTLPTTGGISAVSYSTQKVPYGFPGQKTKWQLTTLIYSPLTVGASATTWYSGATTGAGSFALAVPVGEWDAWYDFEIYTDGNASTSTIHKTTLSTTAGTETDVMWGVQQFIGTITNAAGGPFFESQHSRRRSISTSAQTTYYANMLFSGSIGNPRFSNGGASFITAENAYL